MSNVPKLRFKEFSGEWEEQKLGSLTTLMQSGLSRLLSDTDIGLPVIRSNNLQNGQLDIKELKYWHSVDNQGANTENYFLQEEDLLVNFINSLAQIGKVAMYKNILNRNTIFTTNIMRLRFKESVNSSFIFNFFHTKTYIDYIQSIAKPAVNQASFTTKDLNNLPIFLPQISEQQKIASFLSAVDTKIDQLTRKKELLEQYKKGVMQKIFSQELRFKADDGSEFSEWEEKKLGDVFSEVKEQVKEINIETYSISAGVGFVSQKEKFGKDISGQQNEKYIILKPYQFSYNKGNSKTYNYGCIYPNTTGKSIAVPNVFISFKLKNEQMNFRYFAKLFEMHYLDRSLREIISSSARTNGLLNVNKNYFFTLSIPLPSIEEQNKIANFFSAIDSKTDLASQQLNDAKNFKKGLLQQMFVLRYKIDTN